MKKTILICGLLALVSGVAQATVYTINFSGGFANGGVVPDGNPTGWSDTRSINLTGMFGPLRPGETTAIQDVNVNLNISGGYNGDLYAYLVHSSGFAVLLNRSGRTGTDGFGYGDAGYGITLDDSAANGDIHLYRLTLNPNGGALSGIWSPDGRNIDPASVLDSDGRTALLSSFNGLSADGTWTLFLADLSGGDISTLTGWSLDISVVPEPTTWAMIIFGVGLGGWTAWRYVQKRRVAVQYARI